MSNVIQIRNYGSARCQAAIRSVCAGEQTGYKILMRWQRHRDVVSTMEPTIEDALDDARNFLTDEFESPEEYHHWTDDQVARVVIRPLTKEEASKFCRNIVKDNEII
jgi:hypothetical protein